MEAEAASRSTSLKNKACLLLIYLISFDNGRDTGNNLLRLIFKGMILFRLLNDVANYNRNIRMV